jgi:hypothetical protein
MGSVPRLYNEERLRLREWMLHKDYDRKCLVSNKISGRESQGLGTKTKRLAVNPLTLITRAS